MTRATVITDASFCGETRAAGWAAWIRLDGFPEAVKRYGEFHRPMRNSEEAEMLAVVNGVWIASRLGAERVLVQTDCLAVVRAINGRVKNQKTRGDLTRALATAGVLGLSLRGRHVKGHTAVDDARSYVNRWCDKHAKKAMNSKRAFFARSVERKK